MSVQERAECRIWCKCLSFVCVWDASNVDSRKFWDLTHMACGINVMCYAVGSLFCSRLDQLPSAQIAIPVLLLRFCSHTTTQAYCIPSAFSSNSTGAPQPRNLKCCVCV